MRNKANSPLPESTQAPPASPEPLFFHPHEWESSLRDKVLQTIAFAGGNEPGLEIVNRYLRGGLLEAGRVASDGTITLLPRSYLERWEVCATQPNPAEGVYLKSLRGMPIEPGRDIFVRRAGFAGSTSPAMPAAPADRQLHAEGGSEPTPAIEPTPPAKPKQPAPAEKPTRTRGPAPGTIARFALADRALFPEMTLLIEQQHITAGEAARILFGKIAGRGTVDSKARRMAESYRTEVEKLTATRRDS
jgi:hypothetical protein